MRTLVQVPVSAGNTHAACCRRRPGLERRAADDSAACSERRPPRTALWRAPARTMPGGSPLAAQSSIFLRGWWVGRGCGTEGGLGWGSGAWRPAGSISNARNLVRGAAAPGCPGPRSSRERDVGAAPVICAELVGPQRGCGAWGQLQATESEQAGLCEGRLRRQQQQQHQPHPWGRPTGDRRKERRHNTGTPERQLFLRFARVRTSDLNAADARTEANTPGPARAPERGRCGRGRRANSCRFPRAVNLARARAVPGRCSESTPCPIRPLDSFHLQLGEAPGTGSGATRAWRRPRRPRPPQLKTESCTGVGFGGIEREG